MKAGVVVFPGSNCDHDVYHVIKHVLEKPVEYIWHKESALPKNLDLVVLPGGFSYGDYLRCGAIAKFSPVMNAVIEFASRGGLLLGICNGFQILTEVGLLPGALLKNRDVRFICRFVPLRVETTNSPFTARYRKGEEIRVPIAHGEGNYFCDEETLNRLNGEDRVAFRYIVERDEFGRETNPNGSLDNIAGVLNEKRNILGMMPHPERCSEAVLGGEDGRKLFESILTSLT
ncbi:MAG: phosphoribosylformylglycinamidine synthase subunit PurQ [Myxococcota bacterium]